MLNIRAVMEDQCFVFLWVGETHLEDGRRLLEKWGLRRIEDICWVKTNREQKPDLETGGVSSAVMYEEESQLVRTKEHCILGLKGRVRRSEDGHLIHANVDTDLIMEEEKAFGSTQKPQELYEIIEHVCLGRRRLELFGNDRNLRDGWLTLGQSLTASSWNPDLYESWFQGDGCWPEVQGFVGGKLVGTVREIEELRPKSPLRGRPGVDRWLRESRETRAEAASRDARHSDRVLPEDLGEKAADLPKEETGLDPEVGKRSGRK